MLQRVRTRERRGDTVGAILGLHDMRDKIKLKEQCRYRSVCMRVGRRPFA
jgi:hypothetical protein